MSSWGVWILILKLLWVTFFLKIISDRRIIWFGDRIIYSLKSVKSKIGFWFGSVFFLNFKSVGFGFGSIYKLRFGSDSDSVLWIYNFWFADSDSVQKISLIWFGLWFGKRKPKKALPKDIRFVIRFGIILINIQTFYAKCDRIS